MFDEITLEQGLLKLPSAYHSMLKQIWDEYLQRDEKVLAIAEYTYSEVTERDSSLFLPLNTVKSQPRFVVISSYRWIFGYINYGSKGVGYRGRSGPGSDGPKVFNVWGEYAEWEWKFPPPFPDHKNQHRLRITEVSLSSISAVRSKAEYVTYHQDKPIELLELFMESRNYLTFLREDGEYIYRLLQVSAQNKGTIPLIKRRLEGNVGPTSERLSSSKTEQLIELGKMLQQNLLTIEEFEAAKKKLLS